MKLAYPGPAEPIDLGDTVNVDGRFDERKQIRYIGKATRIQGDSYRCLADVGGALCVVEVTIRLAPEP